MLGSICSVTTVVRDLDSIEHAYTAFLGMRVEARDKVDAAQAHAWGAPACAGCDILVLRPEIGEATRLRFIADPHAGTCAPFTSHGWNATEITVRDTDILAARLADSPFRIIGPPANLKGFETIRAMQVLGPAGECLYLTDVRADASLAQASAEVGQVFIVVVGGPDIDALSAFYGKHFTNEMSDPVAVPIGVINAANHLPADTRHKLGLLRLPDGTRIELDQYPRGTGPRATVPGHLPPGMAMVSFRVERLPEAFAGATCARGAAGELIEFCPVSG
jgi:catechol 2,3-dioxygenase-like lactoylglutathione lyase family enzyme